MKLVIQQEKEADELVRGEGIVHEYKDGTIGLILCCHKCGKASSSKTGGHKYNKETQSVTPSKVHNITLGGCGWHGWVTNGEITPA